MSVLQTVFNVQTIAIIAFLVIIVVFLVLFYAFFWKPRTAYPLPNERVVSDHLSLWAPRGVGVMAGPFQTARTTVERYWNTLIQSEPDKAVRKRFEKNRDFVLKKQIYAMRNGGDNFILVFDQNPEDQKFLTVDPSGGGMILHGVQDAKPLGVFGKFSYVGITLNPEVKTFGETEEAEMDAVMENIMYLRDAAVNTEKIAGLQEEVGDKRRTLKTMQNELATMRSKLDRAVSALGQKPLTQREEPKLKGTVTQRLKEWFSPWQLFSGLAGYFVAPYIVQYAGWELLPPMTTYFTAFVTIVGFFAIPVLKRLLGRWLK